MERFSFSSKHVLVTGSTGRAASAVCHSLAEKGAVIIGNPLLKQPEYGFSGGIETFYEADDVRTPESAENLLERFEYIDVIFNICEDDFFSDSDRLSPDTSQSNSKLKNSSSPFTGILTHMKKRGMGRIINLFPFSACGAVREAGLLSEAFCMELLLSNIFVLNIYSDILNTRFAVSPSSKGNLNDGGESPDLEEKADKIVEIAAGPPGELRIDGGTWRKIAGRIFSGDAFSYYKKRYKTPPDPKGICNSPLKRKWRLFQVETSIGCNLKCIMCPWAGYRKELKGKAMMEETVWNSIARHLHRVRSVDFTGGGEPLLQPSLTGWMKEAKTAGCETGFLTNGLLLSKEMSAKVLGTRPDWIGFSLDGATRQVYEKIRPGSDFGKVCGNIKTFTTLRRGDLPFVMINFVIMRENLAQLEDIILLAAELGVDQVNFKQCDVIRNDYGRDLGLFKLRETPEILKMKKALGRAKKRGKKLNVKVRAFSFTPDQLPVCHQDPRTSLFISHNGMVSPCINLAIGGASQFLGKDVVIPSVHYGRLPEKNIDALWESETSRLYRKRFQQRVEIHDYHLAKSDFGEANLLKFKKALNDAVAAMPEAPEGCRVCHYLYDI